MPPSDEPERQDAAHEIQIQNASSYPSLARPEPAEGAARQQAVDQAVDMPRMVEPQLRPHQIELWAARHARSR